MKNLITAAVTISLLTSPAFGQPKDAAFASGAGGQLSHTSLFAGVSYRVSFDRRIGERPGRASLKFAGMNHIPSSSELRFSQGLEIAGGRTGKPALHFAGQDIGQLNQKAQLKGTQSALIIGGVLVLGVVVALVALDAHKDNKCSDGPDECG